MVIGPAYNLSNIKNNKQKSVNLNAFLDATNKAVNIFRDTANKIGSQNTETNPFRANYPTLSSSGSGSGGGGGMIDLSNIMASYDQAAESNRQVAKQTYESKRSDLLTSLKRFQEQNAKDVQRQQRTYLSDQASLESAIAQADRQNRINAASRGLGGSGLQQLSQLQNLLSQGQTISDMATKNQDTLETLRNNLSNYEEDTNKSLNDILNTYNNTLSSINSDLALNKANIEYQARENAASRAASASSVAAQIAAQNAEYEANAAQDEKAFRSQLDTLQRAYRKEASSISSMSKSELEKAYKTRDYAKARKTLYDNYDSSLSTLLNNYNLGGTNVGKSAYNSLYDIYKNSLSNNVENEINNILKSTRSIIGVNKELSRWQ